MSVVLRQLNKAINEKTNQDWEEDFEKEKSQHILNVLSCIQLSNKLYSSDIVRCHIFYVIFNIIKLYLKYIFA